MLNIHRLGASAILGIVLSLSLHAQERLNFAWPDSVVARVDLRSEGKQVSPSKTQSWDMSSGFTMQLKRDKDNLVVSRHSPSDWKGTLAPVLGAGAEQFAHLVPTLIVTRDGAFVGIEGHETARKLMTQTIEQSGGLNDMQRSLYEMMSSNASLEAMARDHWSMLTAVWRLVELEPDAIYEFQTVAQIPQLGGGELNINGLVKFVKETPCESTRNDQRCIHLYSESVGDKAQVSKIIQKLLEQKDPTPLAVTDWDQRIKVDIVLEKKTMLPHRLKVTRFHSLTVKHLASGESQTSWGEYSTTYTYAWQKSN